VGVFKRGTGGFAMVLENQDVLEAAVFFEIEDAVAEGPEYVFDALGGEIGQAGVVIRGFDDDFVRANAVHAVKHALGLAVEIALDAKCGELVGNHAHCPTGRVALRRRATVRIGAVGLDLRRSLRFVTVTKRTEPPSYLHSVTSKI